MTQRAGEVLGCGDNSCMFGPPGGMATNGGCRCIDRHGMSQLDVIRVRRGVQALRDRLRAVEGELMVLRDAAVTLVEPTTKESELWATPEDWPDDAVAAIERWKVEEAAWKDEEARLLSDRDAWQESYIAAESARCKLEQTAQAPPYEARIAHAEAYAADYTHARTLSCEEQRAAWSAARAGYMKGQEDVRALLVRGEPAEGEK